MVFAARPQFRSRRLVSWLVMSALSCALTAHAAEPGPKANPKGNPKAEPAPAKPASPAAEASAKPEQSPDSPRDAKPPPKGEQASEKKPAPGREASPNEKAGAKAEPPSLKDASAEQRTSEARSDDGRKPGEEKSSVPAAQDAKSGADASAQAPSKTNAANGESTAPKKAASPSASNPEVPADKKTTPTPADASPDGPPPQPTTHALPPTDRRLGTKHEGLRRHVAGGPTRNDVALGAESETLRILSEDEKRMFLGAAPAFGAPWPTDEALPLLVPSDRPHVHATGVPPTADELGPTSDASDSDLEFLKSLQLPSNFPARLDARVVNYLKYFKDNPRGKRLIRHWIARSGRYRDRIRGVLRRRALPDALLWVAMIESGFDATIRSPAGAAGLWQFMPRSAKDYGLVVTRWVDQRLDPEAATLAAADFMADLHRRFGSWELALAAYNMGYAGMTTAIQRYNTNDFWRLTELEGAVPWETTLYVPKAIAVNIIAQNPTVFGIDRVTVEPAIETEQVRVGSGVALSTIARAADEPLDKIRELNPELRAGRTPPKGKAGEFDGYWVRVPKAKGARTRTKLAKNASRSKPLETVDVKVGDTIEELAHEYGVTAKELVAINGLAEHERLAGGSTLFLPRGAAPARRTKAKRDRSTADDDPRELVVVPSAVFVYPDRRRVFYRVQTGDTLPEIAQAASVSIDDVRRWNEINPGGRLQAGMTLQLFVPKEERLTAIRVLEENDVRTVVAGSEDFIEVVEKERGRKRIEIKARKDETLAEVGKRFGVSPGWMERVNHRGRRDKLNAGEVVIAYVDEKRVGGRSSSASDGDEAGGLQPLPPLDAGPILPSAIRTQPSESATPAAPASGTANAPAGG